MLWLCFAADRLQTELAAALVDSRTRWYYSTTNLGSFRSPEPTVWSDPWRNSSDCASVIAKCCSGTYWT